MSTSKCIICSSEFPFRKGKLYCSNSCKQQGYINKKNGIQSPEKKIFFISDYNNFLKQCQGNDHVDFITYCFGIKNFDEGDNEYFINEFADNIFTENFLNSLQKENHPVGRQFLQFQNEFHIGNYKVMKERLETNKASE